MCDYSEGLCQAYVGSIKDNICIIYKYNLVALNYLQTKDNDKFTCPFLCPMRSLLSITSFLIKSL